MIKKYYIAMKQPEISTVVIIQPLRELRYASQICYKRPHRVYRQIFHELGKN